MFKASWCSTLKKVMLDPSTLSNISTIQEIETLEVDDHKFRTAIDKLCENIRHVDTNKKCMIGADVYNDIEFFKCFNDRNTITLFDVINNCKLKGSTEALKTLMSCPVYDTQLLNNRIQHLEKLTSDDETNAHTFELLARYENDVAWLFEEVDANLKDLYQLAYFRFCMFKGLNKNASALTGYNFYRIIMSPLIGIFSPILYFVIPYMIITFRFKINISFQTYLKIVFQTLTSGSSLLYRSSNISYIQIISWLFSLVFYFQGIFNSVEIAKTLHKIIKHLVEKTNNVVDFLKHSVDLQKKFWNDELVKYFYSCDILKTTPEEETYVRTLTTKPYSLLNNFGQQLKTYITLDKDIVRSITLKTYIIESLMSLTMFKKKYNYGYVRFLEGESRPHIQCNDMCHPCIDTSKVVKNDISIGKEDKNIIITGPNAGGKSTFIKSLIITTILAQTSGIANCSDCAMTPFYYINSQINIPDSKGYESLFEAEMYRCKYNLDQLKQRHPNEFTMIIMDEIFNSTNPIEGIAGAYSIAKKISEYTNCILVFTTHYLYLTKLENNTQRFKNYKMNVEHLEDKTLRYPYLLSRGVSKQYIALELLEKNGFDKDIIDEALQIKTRLTIPKDASLK